jgi:hypothetical protein
MKALPFIRPALAGAGALALVLLGAQGPGNVRRIRFLTPEQEEILSHLSIVHLDDGTGTGQMVKTIRLTSANFQIVNGLGSTNGYPTIPNLTDPTLTRTNGLGNLIVGYNELIPHPSPAADHGDRTGSHNLIVGMDQGYTSYGGFLGGRSNGIKGPYSSIVGGEDNRVDARFSSILGGLGNMAPNSVNCWNAISGGANNIAMGRYSSIGGGQSNRTQGDYSAVGGGLSHTATDRFDWAAGDLYEDQ